MLRQTGEQDPQHGLPHSAAAKACRIDRPLPRAFAALVSVCAALLTTPSTWAHQTVPAPAPAAKAPSAAFVPDAGAPFLPWDQAWPARWNRTGPGVQGVVRTLDVRVTTLQPRRAGDLNFKGVDDESDFRLLTGGLADPECEFDLEGPNSVLFESVPDRRRRGLGTGPGPDAGPPPALVFRFISGEADPGAAGVAPHHPVVRLQRTWFAYYDPVGQKAEGVRAPAPPTRATVLILPGIFGNPEPTIDRLVLALRQSGYGVLRMLCQPSRFTERVVFVIEHFDPPHSAQEIARHYDNRTAECAYAAQAAWAFVEEQRPTIKPLPRLMIGMSGGAITLPAVVARESSRYAGAVLIGGAADYWLTTQRSNYRNIIGAVTVVWQVGVPRPEQERELDHQYLQHARLDAFHAAAALKGRPVLVLQGLADQAVPSTLGDLLWERLGRPERWTYPLGHELLFAGLPAEFPRLLEWLNAVVDKCTKPAGGPP